MSSFSKGWKKGRWFFQGLEDHFQLPIGDSKSGLPCDLSAIAQRATAEERRAKQGSALIVALWVLIILSLLIGAFAFDMHVEAGITSYYRKRMKAQYLAYAGVEYAKVVLSKDSSKEKDKIMKDEEKAMNDVREALEVGGEVSLTRDLGAGRIEVRMKPETSKWDVNKIGDDVWKEILEFSGVPTDKVDELIDCFKDYTDPGDEHHVNGAESDDPYYEQRGYECKNGPVDSVEELLRIKGFTPSIVFGGPAENEDDEPLKGIADVLTVWGNGDRIDAMSSSDKALNGILELNEDEIRRLIESRAGADGELPESLQELLADAGIPEDFSKVLGWGKPAYVEVTSVGEVQGVRSTVLCTLYLENGKSSPVAWREGDLP